MNSWIDKHVEASAPGYLEEASCEARMTKPSYEDQTHPSIMNIQESNQDSGVMLIICNPLNNRRTKNRFHKVSSLCLCLDRMEGNPLYSWQMSRPCPRMQPRSSTNASSKCRLTIKNHLSTSIRNNPHCLDVRRNWTSINYRRHRGQWNDRDANNPCLASST